MRRCIGLIMALLVVWGMLEAQEAKQQIEKLDKIVKFLAGEKVAAEASANFDGQMDKAVREAQKAYFVLYPPFIPKGWQATGYNDGWTATTSGPVPCSVKYEPPKSWAEAGFWGVRLSDAQKRQICQKYGVSSLPQLSKEQKKNLLEFVLARTLAKDEEYVLAQSDLEGYDFLLPEVFENRFYAMHSDALSLQWEGWEKESKALENALRFWKGRVELGVSPKEKREIDKWTDVLRKRSKMLDEEKEAFDRIFEIHEKRALKFVLLDDIARLSDAISMCKSYASKVESKLISSYHSQKVSNFQQEWENQQKQLENVKSLAFQIQNSYQNLESRRNTLSPKDLASYLESLMKLLQNYQKVLQEQKLDAYREQDFSKWMREIQGDIEKTVLAAKVVDVEDAYEKWSVRSNKSSIEEELKALQNFFSVYETNRNEVGQNAKVQDWFARAQAQKQALEAEDAYFKRVAKMVSQLSQPGAVSQRISNAQAILAECDSYANLGKQGKVSQYYKNQILELQRQTEASRQKWEAEEQAFGQADKAYQEYKKASYESPQQEREAIEKLFPLLKKYETAVQYKQVEGNYLSQVKELLAEVQNRRKLVMEEEEILNLVQPEYRNWLSQTEWPSIVSEENTIRRIVENCRKYIEKAGKKEISAYQQENVKKWEEKASLRFQQIQAERSLWDKIQGLQNAYASSPKYPDIDSEKKALLPLVVECETYIEKRAKKEISDYYYSQVVNWQGRNAARKKSILEEESLNSNLTRNYGIWQGKSWESAEAEMKAVEEVLLICQDYQSKLTQGLIAGYYKENVAKYQDLMKAHSKKVNEERNLYRKVKADLTEASEGKYKDFEEESAKWDALLQLQEDYVKKVKGAEITQYHRVEMDALVIKNREKSQRLKTVHGLFSRVKSEFQEWESKTWQGLEEEKKAVEKALGLIQDYENKVKEFGMADYHAAKIAEWRKRLQDQDKRLEEEKELYEKYKKDNRAYNKGDFTGIEDEKGKIKDIMDTCDLHAARMNKNEITGHHEKTMRAMKRKLSVQFKKLEAEDSIFQVVKKSYTFWKSNSPWSNEKDEKQALGMAIQNVQMYKDRIDAKRITSYYEKTVKDYESEMNKRIEEIKRKESQ